MLTLQDYEKLNASPYKAQSYYPGWAISHNMYAYHGDTTLTCSGCEKTGIPDDGHEFEEYCPAWYDEARGKKSLYDYERIAGEQKIIGEDIQAVRRQWIVKAMGLENSDVAAIVASYVL